MRFSTAILPLLPLLAAGLPLATRDNASSTSANALANGINANLDAGNKEIAAVQQTQSALQNGGDVAAGEAAIQGALDEAVGDRTNNQQLAGEGAAVQQGLSKVETAQGKAQGKIDGLTGTAADATAVNDLGTTFQGGFKTNEQNLQTAQQSNQ